MNSVHAFVPATVANVTCAFDILGFSLTSPGDEVIVKKTNTKKVVISRVTGDDGNLSLDIKKNTVTVSILSCLEAYNIKNVGLDIELHKKMPIGCGLGSSAASSVAGVFAVNHLLSLGLSHHEMLPHAIQGEWVACGASHADNVAPALLGGLVLIRSSQPLDIVQLPYPSNLFVAVIFPKTVINTKDARDILPLSVSLSQAVKQWGNIGGLIAGFSTKDISLIKRSMIDEIVESQRAALIPGFYEAKKISIHNGAIGFGISGSGPSLFALCEGEKNAERVANKIMEMYREKNIDSKQYISTFGSGTPVILDKH